MTRVAILGAGNGGCAAAADLSIRGFDVSLYSRSQERLAAINEAGGLYYTGVIGDGFAPLTLVTNNLARSLEHADLVMIVTPAIAHRYLALQLAELLAEATPIWLNPGATGGALHVSEILRRHGRSDIPVAESATLTYACRMKGPNTVWIKNQVTNLLFATFPTTKQTMVLESYRKLYPALKPAVNVLTTSLMNLNAILHPPGMIMNAGRIEYTKGDFKFYYEGITPVVANVIEAIDLERLAIVQSLEVHLGYPLGVSRGIDFFYQANYTTKEAWHTGSIYQALQASIPNRPTQAAPSLNDRYITEDVPYGLAPMLSLAEWIGVPAPVMRSLVGLAAVMTGENYFETGLTLADMGLDQIDAGHLRSYLEEGLQEL